MGRHEHRAYFYNHNLKTHGGQDGSSHNIKEVPDRLAKAIVADYERGLTSEIMPYAWQSETCIGQWHYRRSLSGSRVSMADIWNPGMLSTG